MKDGTHFLPGFHLSTVRRKPRSGARKLADEKRRIRQRRFKKRDCALVWLEENRGETVAQQFPVLGQLFRSTATTRILVQGKTGNVSDPFGAPSIVPQGTGSSWPGVTVGTRGNNAAVGFHRQPLSNSLRASA